MPQKATGDHRVHFPRAQILVWCTEPCPLTTPPRLLRPQPSQPKLCFELLCHTILTNLLTILNPPTHWDERVEPSRLSTYLPFSVLSFFISSILLFFLSSEPSTPSGEVYLPPLTPLAPARDALWDSGLPGTYLFRCQHSHQLLTTC